MRLRPTRPLALLIGLGLGALLVACSDSSARRASEQESASAEQAQQVVDDFCGAYGRLFEVTGDEHGGGEGVDRVVSAYLAWAGEIDEGGVPPDMPDAAEEGLGVLRESVSQLDAESGAADLARIEGDLSDEEAQAVQALNRYVTTACPQLLGSTG